MALHLTKTTTAKVDMDTETDPTISIDEIAESYSKFYEKLLRGDLKMPCWIQIGDSAFRVTKENHRALSLGMQMCLEARGYFGR